jgi:transcriptional regulator with XRE-family HTH domain
MNGQRLGAAIRAVRIKRGLTQRELAARAGTSQSQVSRLERGHVDAVGWKTIERVCAVLDMQIYLSPRWRGGDLDRLLNAGHAQMHEAIARWFRRWYAGWTPAPEVSFAIWGERGVIDILAWHEESRTLLVIELKTDVVDLNEVVGTLDRKRRLAVDVARSRGWEAEHVGVWLVVAAGRTNRRRIPDHAAFLRSAYPQDGRAIRSWLAPPSGSIAALSMESFGAGRPSVTHRRVTRRRPAA